MNDLVVFHDVDGCLNAASGDSLALQEGEFTNVEEKRLSEFGLLLEESPVSHFVLNTGRSWEATRFICQAIDCAKLQYALVEHGAELWEVETQSPIDFGSLQASSNVDGLSEALATREQIAELVDWFEKDGAADLARVMEHPHLITYATDKSWNLTLDVPASLSGDEMLAHLEILIGEVSNFQATEFVFHHSRWNRFLDVMGQMDKGLGMAAWSALLGVNLDNTVAIGDGLNDLSMLKRAAIPVCPANAEPEVIQLCETRGYVSEGCYIDGTVEWLDQL